MTRSFRAHAIRWLTPLTMFAAALLAAACSDSFAPSAGSASAHVRVVGSVFKGDVYDPTPGAVAAVPIDFLVDSATTYGELNIPEGAVWSGQGASHYREIPAGIHSYVARVAGDTTPNNTLYHTKDPYSYTFYPYLPKMHLVSGGYFTVIVSGVISPYGADTSITWVAGSDDPFPGPRVNGTYQARFRVINAAPFASQYGSGAGLQVYVTPGASPPPSISDYQPFFTVFYRQGSAYANLNAGTYVVTIVVLPGGGDGGQGDLIPGTIGGFSPTARFAKGGGPPPPPVAGPIIVQDTVTFADGDVRTLVVQSTAQAEVPGTNNHRMTVLVDHTYGSDGTETSAH